MWVTKVMLFNGFLLSSLIGLILYQGLANRSSLSGTRWACAQLDESFITQGYQQYKAIENRSVLKFISDINLEIYRFGHLTTQQGEDKKYEIYLELDYLEERQGLLSMTFNNIEWNLKPTHSDIFVRNIDTLVDSKVELRFETRDKQLFLFTQGGAEEGNYACFKN